VAKSWPTTAYCSISFSLRPHYPPTDCDLPLKNNVIFISQGGMSLSTVLLEWYEIPIKRVLAMTLPFLFHAQTPDYSRVENQIAHVTLRAQPEGIQAVYLRHASG